MTAKKAPAKKASAKKAAPAPKQDDNAPAKVLHRVGDKLLPISDGPTE